jgi:hypothetical protein
VCCVLHFSFSCLPFQGCVENELTRGKREDESVSFCSFEQPSPLRAASFFMVFISVFFFLSRGHRGTSLVDKAYMLIYLFLLFILLRYSEAAVQVSVDLPLFSVLGEATVGICVCVCICLCVCECACVWPSPFLSPLLFFLPFLLCRMRQLSVKALGAHTRTPVLARLGAVPKQRR